MSVFLHSGGGADMQCVLNCIPRISTPTGMIAQLISFWLLIEKKTFKDVRVSRPPFMWSHACAAAATAATVVLMFQETPE